MLSGTSGGISTIYFASIISAPVGIASASFSLTFSLTTGIIEKKHNRIVTPARSKLNRIENLISQALIDLEISHEEYKTIINEEENYRKLKENIDEKY